MTSRLKPDTTYVYEKVSRLERSVRTGSAEDLRGARGDRTVHHELDRRRPLWWRSGTRGRGACSTILLRLTAAIGRPARHQPRVRPVARRRYDRRNPPALGGGEADKHVIYEGLSRAAADAVLSARRRSAAAISWSPFGTRACRLARVARPATASDADRGDAGGYRPEGGLMFDVHSGWRRSPPPGAPRSCATALPRGRDHPDRDERRARSCRRLRPAPPARSPPRVVHRRPDACRAAD